MVEETDLLREEMQLQEFESYKEGEINWVERDFYNSWEKVKGHSKKLWRHKKEYLHEDWKPFFLAHDKDSVKGKPQLIEAVQKKIPLVRLAVQKTKNKNEGTEEIEIQSFYFFDERFDKRHDGFQIDCFALDFWLYRIISQEGKEYFIFSQKQLPNCTCTFNGMLVELDDFAEMSRSMKVKSLSRIFFLKEFEPDIKILSPEQLITYTKEREIREQDWIDFIAYHNFGTMNKYTYETEMLRSSHLLSGKKDGYPQHLFIWGPTGTRKTMGFIEAPAQKFSEQPEVCEGGNSRIKGLSPSFKEKPANIGVIARAERMCFIDEWGKMVEFELNKHQNTQSNVMGELNFLLEHKYREVTSGNDNSCKVQATCKTTWVSNASGGKSTIYQHIGMIDPTFLSRGLHYCLDEVEQKFVLSPKGIVKVPPTPTQAHPLTESKGILIEKEKKDILLKMCWGKVSSREEFLTLFDSCYNFICEVNEEEVERLVNVTSMLAREPMKTSVWKPRAFHHIFLLIDGLVKHRCLFKDYDPSFTPIQEDYDLAERILIRMVKSWDTNLSPKEEFRS